LSKTLPMFEVMGTEEELGGNDKVNVGKR
jgi:hypothetical protein